MEDRHEYAKIESYKLIALPQVRKIKNSRIAELAASIATKGLINAINVARLTTEEFQNYIDFINELWEENIKIENYQAYDGYYYLVIAGHSRFNACKLNGMEKIDVKIHYVNTPEEILGIQLDENIHEKISEERRAVAIIENYYIGLRRCWWQNKEEFVIKNKHNFSRKDLEDALVFIELPKAIQKHIFAGNVYYDVGIELGKISDLILKYETNEWDGKDLESLEQAIYWRYIEIMADIQSQRRKSIKGGKKVIKDWQEKLEKKLGIIISTVGEDEQMSIDLENALERQYFQYLQARSEEVKIKMQALKNDRFNEVIALYQLGTNMLGIKTAEDIKTLESFREDYVSDVEHGYRLRKTKEAV